MSDLDKLFFSEGSTNPTRRFKCDTGVTTLTRFPACGAIIVSVKRETEVATLSRSGLVFIRLVGGHIENAIKLPKPEPGKTQNTKIRQNTMLSL